MRERASIPVFAAVALALFGCSERDPETAYPAQIAYREDGRILVLTPAGIMTHDADLQRREAAISLDEHVGGLLEDEALTFSVADDGRLAAVTFSNTVDRDIGIYDLTTGRLQKTLNVDASYEVPVQGAALAPDGARIFVRAQRWGMYDVETGAQLWGKDSQDPDCCGFGLRAPIFSRDGQVLFGFGETQLEARQALSGELIFSVERGSDRGASGTLAHAGTEGVLVGTRTSSRSGLSRVGDEQAYVFWSEQDGSVLKEFPQFPDRSFFDAFPGGSPLACSAVGDVCASAVIARGEQVRDGGEQPALEHFIDLWTSDGVLLREIPAFANALAFSPDGSHLAVAGAQAELYRVSDGVRVGSFQYSYGGY
jgi:outer membrane protein assembly factor BamB